MYQLTFLPLIKIVLINDLPTFARLLILSEMRAAISRLIFHGKMENREKHGAKMGILALKTQKGTPRAIPR